MLPAALASTKSTASYTQFSFLQVTSCFAKRATSKFPSCLVSLGCQGWADWLVLLPNTSAGCLKPQRIRHIGKMFYFKAMVIFKCWPVVACSRVMMADLLIEVPRYS